MTKVIVKVVLFSLCMSCALLNAQSWPKVAQYHLNAIRNIIRSSTPQYADEKPRFLMWFNKGYQRALALAQQKTTAGGYVYSVAYYVIGFSESHMHVDLPILSGNQRPKVLKKLNYQFAGILEKCESL